MTTLKILDKVGLGQLIIEAARNPEVRERLVADANAALAGLVQIPDGHRVKAIPADENVTLMMIPTRNDIDAGDPATSQNFGYSAEYDPNDPAFINPATDAARAYAFLVGDYILKDCK